MNQLKWTWHTFEQLSKEDLYLILMERVNVFVVEQTCPYPEIDHRDQEALHVIAKENGTIVHWSCPCDEGRPEKRLREDPARSGDKKAQ